MVKKTLLLVMLFVLSVSSIFSVTFDEEKIKTSDGMDFIFPMDALRAGPAIFALSMGKDRSNGEAQQQEVIAWQRYFNENPKVLGSIPVYHFPVLSGVPFSSKVLSGKHSMSIMQIVLIPLG